MNVMFDTVIRVNMSLQKKLNLMINLLEVKGLLNLRFSKNIDLQ